MPHTDSAYVHKCTATFHNPTLAFRIDHTRKHGSATRFNGVETQSRTILVKHGEVTERGAGAGAGPTT
jgi:hypothetical protein